MSFEYIIEKENKVKKLSGAEEESLVSSITSDFDNFNSARRENLEKSQELINAIFFKNKYHYKHLSEVGIFDDNELPKSEKWKTKVRMCKLYMLYATLKAFIWKNTYSNVNSMFDVSGENLEADNDSNKQKAALVDNFEKMEYQKVCDEVIDYALYHGELITFCGWRKKKEEYRKLIEEEDLQNPKAIRALNSGKFHYVAERIVYDNPYVEAINPANLVFDVSQRKDWDNCPKIYKSYKNPDDIINNKYYQVSDEVAKELRDMVKSPDHDKSQLDDDLEDETINAGTVEVLEHWGNLRLQDGTLLKNWHAVVVARKYLVRFEENSRIINPFTYGTFIRDPETGRGISPIYAALSLSQMQEDLMNRTCDMQALSENPPIFAPKGFFEDDEVQLYPGKIIEYGDNLTPSQIQPMQFNVGVFLNDITFLSDLMSEVTGIFPNMAGADEQKAKTATEISTKTQGQLTRLSQLIDTINQEMIVPDVKKVAKLNADFKSGEEQIFVNKGDKKEVITIDDNVRKAEYRYTYSDRTATTERSNKADMVAAVIEKFAKYIPLNGQELFTWYMEQKDVENPERFLQQQMIPPEIQEMLLQNPQIQQIVQNFNQQKEAIEKGEKPQQAIPDQSIPQAQPME